MTVSRKWSIGMNERGVWLVNIILDQDFKPQ